MAYYMATNPVVMRNRVKRMSRKPKESGKGFEGMEERATKRLRLEKWVEDAAVKIEGEEG